MAGLFKKERFYINIQLKAWLRNTVANNIFKKSLFFDRRESYLALLIVSCLFFFKRVIEGFHKYVSKK